jgi:hypothetical protein
MILSPCFLFFFLFVCFVFCPLCLSAPGPFVDEWGNPQKIFVLASFNKISKVDGVEQLFSTDLYLTQYWIDRRLQAENVTVDSVFDTESMFTPQLDFVNGNSVTSLVDSPYYFITRPWWATDELMAANNFTDSDIWSVCDQRYTGDFTVLLDFEEFPYDSQNAELKIESLYTAENLVLEFYKPITPDNLKSVLPLKFSVIGWNVHGVAISAFNQFYTSYQDSYHRLVIQVHLTRQPDYYVNKFISGVVLLVLLSVMLFVLPVNEADRMSATLATFAGLITYLFVITQDSPRVPYSTRLDSFMAFSFYITAIMFFIHGFLYLFCQVEDEQENQQEKEVEEELLSFRGNTGFGDPANNRKRIRAIVTQFQAEKILSRQGTLNHIPVEEQVNFIPNVPMNNPTQPINQAPTTANSPDIEVQDKSDQQDLELSIKQRQNISSNEYEGERPHSSISMPNLNNAGGAVSSFRNNKQKEPKQLKSGILSHPRIQRALTWLRSWAITRQSDYFFVVLFSFVYLIGSAYILKGPIINKQGIAEE